jgi:hypothetical protein
VRCPDDKKEDNWCKPFIDFILDELVPEDKPERERITRRSANYVVISTDLYRKATSTNVSDQKFYSSWLRLIATNVAAMQRPPTWSVRNTNLDSTDPRP